MFNNEAKKTTLDVRCEGNRPTAVLMMIALQLSWRISVKKRAKRCNIGVEVVARTCSSFIASRMVDSNERAQSVTALLCDTSGDDDDDDADPAEVAVGAEADDTEATATE